jgi:hypothetical protein
MGGCGLFQKFYETNGSVLIRLRLEKKSGRDGKKMKAEGRGIKTEKMEMETEKRKMNTKEKSRWNRK